MEAYILVSQASPNPAVKEAEEMTQFLSDFKNMHLLKSVLHERISYRRAALNGMAVSEYKPEDLKATEEITSLYKEIFN